MLLSQLIDMPLGICHKAAKVHVTISWKQKHLWPEIIILSGTCRQQVCQKRRCLVFRLYCITYQTTVISSYSSELVTRCAFIVMSCCSRTCPQSLCFAAEQLDSVGSIATNWISWPEQVAYSGVVTCLHSAVLLPTPLCTLPSIVTRSVYSFGISSV